MLLFVIRGVQVSSAVICYSRRKGIKCCYFIICYSRCTGIKGCYLLFQVYRYHVLLFVIPGVKVSSAVIL